MRRLMHIMNGFIQNMHCSHKTSLNAYYFTLTIKNDHCWSEEHVL